MAPKSFPDKLRGSKRAKHDVLIRDDVRRAAAIVRRKAGEAGGKPRGSSHPARARAAKSNKDGQSKSAKTERPQKKIRDLPENGRRRQRRVLDSAGST